MFLQHKITKIYLKIIFFNFLKYTKKIIKTQLKIIFLNLIYDFIFYI